MNIGRKCLWRLWEGQACGNPPREIEAIARGMRPREWRTRGNKRKQSCSASLQLQCIKGLSWIIVFRNLCQRPLWKSGTTLPRMQDHNVVLPNRTNAWKMLELKYQVIFSSLPISTFCNILLCIYLYLKVIIISKSRKFQHDLCKTWTLYEGHQITWYLSSSNSDHFIIRIDCLLSRW